MKNETIAILGSNGHLGRAAAIQFLALGWRVIGFGRADRRPIPGMEFVAGNADSVTDIARAVREAPVVLNALHLPYDKWGHGAAEALSARVISACAGSGKTLLFPGNIYNYRATDTVITPDLRQDPETERGVIRVAMEQQLAAAARSGALQVVILRAGNFYGSDQAGDWFGALILRDAAKGRVMLNPAHTVKNAWAYLPDLAQAFAVLAEQRQSFAACENFHFAGHLANADELYAALQKAVPNRLKRVGYPWLLLQALGIFQPVIRGLVQMRYIWEHELGLQDERLTRLLGTDFGTPFEAAVASAARPYFVEARRAA